MKITTQVHTSDFVSDATDGSGEMSMNGNIFIDVLGATESERQTIRAILQAHYKEICAALKNVGVQ
jgi:hypothetical protein